ncbi:MAG: AbiV family abortive infection protein [Burkholderiales bacterium]
MFKSDQDCWNGAILATKNARRLYNNAIAIYSEEDLGCSSALMVLSAEESSKALAVGLHIVRRVSNKYLKPFFSNHKHKHKHAVYISSLLQKLAEGQPAIPNGLEFLNFTEAWKSSANAIKQKGFYVGYVEGNWLTPESISNKEYLAMKVQAEILLTFAKSFFIQGTLQELLAFRDES